MPYYPEGPTPLLPALAGLASAYYNVKNQISEQKNRQQEIDIQRAAAQAQYGLDQNLKPLPNPLTGQTPGGQQGTQPVNPADFSKLGGTSTSGTPSSTSFNPDPRSGSMPQNRDQWISRAEFIQNELPNIPLAYRADAQSMISDAYRAADESTKGLVWVTGPNGQMIPVSSNTYYGKNTVGAGTEASIAAANKRQQNQQNFERGQHPMEFAIDPETGNLVPVPTATAFSQDKADVRSQNSSNNKKGTVTFNEVQSMYNEWAKGSPGPAAQDQQGNTYYPVVPPSQDERNYMAQAIDAIQSSANPKSAAAAAIAAYKKHFYPKGKPDQEAIRILNDAAKEAEGASGGSDDSRNPTERAPRKIAQADIWDMLVKHGATPQEATTLTAIAIAESGGDANNVNPHDPLGNGKFQHAWGLFQLGNGTNDPNAYPGWDDPDKNTEYAIQKLRSQGLSAWGTYNRGTYKQYLPNG